jgi:tight adherence protein B
MHAIDFAYLAAIFLVTQVLVIGLVWSALKLRVVLWNRSRDKSFSQGESNQEASLVTQTNLTLDTRLSAQDTINDVLGSMPLGSLRRLLVQSGLPLRLDAVLLVSSLTFIAFFVIAFLSTRSSLLATLAGFASLSLPVGLLFSIRSLRQKTLSNQLPFALDSLSRAMQAGHSFSVALRIASRDLDDPIASELRLTSEEINFGTPIRQAMERLTDRVNTADIRFFVAAVVIHMQTGGRLSELLAGLASIIRERQKLVKTIRVLSAEGRFSAWILVVLPLVTGLFVYLINPSLMSILWTSPQGTFLIKVSVGLTLLGLIWMAWISRPQL